MQLRIHLLNPSQTICIKSKLMTLFLHPETTAYMKLQFHSESLTLLVGNEIPKLEDIPESHRVAGLRISRLLFLF